MWFCFSSDFLNFPFTTHIKERCPKCSPNIAKHILSAIKLIASSINYPVIKKNSESDIAWDVLVEDGILREVESGFSALEWLSEQGLFDQKRVKKNITVSQQEKIAVRDNVFITQGEFDSLKEKYDANAIEKAFDLLSEYKARTGKVYRSDYRALISWALKKESHEHEHEHEQPKDNHDEQTDVTPEQKEINVKRMNELIKRL